ncbi:MAG: metallophosphoesterase family protein [Bacillota bacterium]
MVSFLKRVVPDFMGNIFHKNCEFPQHARESKEVKILHISDTPECIYPYIYKVVEKSSADVIIHTGDLVDNIKLEYEPERYKSKYQKRSADFINNLEKLTDARIIYVPGNHDINSILLDNIDRGEVYTEGSIIEVGGVKIGLAHYSEKLPQDAQINLFGHNYDRPFSENGIFLNGIFNINCILLPSCKTYKLDYPRLAEKGRKLNSSFSMI